MSTPHKIVATVAGALLIAVVAAGALFGIFPTDRDGHPPCDQLPSLDEAAAALAHDPDFAAEIEALGDRITVEVDQPCDEHPDRALITVAYGSRAERDDIRALVGRRDGFGVPLHLKRHSH